MMLADATALSADNSKKASKKRTYKQSVFYLFNFR